MFEVTVINPLDALFLRPEEVWQMLQWKCMRLDSRSVPGLAKLISRPEFRYHVTCVAYYIAFPEQPLWDEAARECGLEIVWDNGDRARRLVRFR